MKLGVIGLGRMGGNICLRLMEHGHECVVFDRSKKTVDEIAAKGAAGAIGLQDMIGQLPPPRIVWVMLPSGKITEETVNALGDALAEGDIIIDGGNSMYKDDIRRACGLRKKGIVYVAVGTSGGVWRLQRGYCMMIGGEADTVKYLDPILSVLAPGEGTIEKISHREDRDPTAERGYRHCGPAGAGHFVKMMHNGIEYGIMEAYAEGFDILKNKNNRDLAEDGRFNLNMGDIAEVWRRGSVISSWLLDLSASALAKDKKLDEFSGDVADSGEGRWTVEAGVEEGVPASVLTAALFSRFRSQQQHNFGEKMLSAMRFGFGGHVEPKIEGR